jgi:SAM-dependent methyltransferase
MSSIYFQSNSIFSYKTTASQLLTATLALSIATICIIAKTCFCYRKSASALSEKTFWQVVEKSPMAINEKSPIVIGGTSFPNLAAAQKSIALSCTKMSDYVYKHVIQSSFQGTVLDLGCGIGVNSIPLTAKGCQVTIIDQEKDAIAACYALQANLRRISPNYCDLKAPYSIVGDITDVAYPERIDAVICVDTLPYIRPSKLKATMTKIFQALRPGGLFIGTIFFIPKKPNDSVIIAMRKCGVYFYKDKDFAHEIITRSGFAIKKETERQDHERIPSHCLEFLAVKPS